MFRHSLRKASALLGRRQPATPFLRQLSTTQPPTPGAATPTIQPQAPAATTVSSEGSKEQKDRDQEKDGSGSGQGGQHQQNDGSYEQGNASFASKIHPGVYMLVIFGTVGGMIYRQQQHTKRSKAVKTKITDEAVIAPSEMKQLREANNVSVQQFKDVIQRVRTEFPSLIVPVAKVESTFWNVVESTNPEGIHNRHHLDRVMIQLNATAPKEADNRVVLSLLNMMVKGSVYDRLRLLFRVWASEVLDQAPAEAADSKNPIPQGEDQVDGKITRDDFIAMIDFLKNGFQMEYSYAPYQTKKWPLPEFRPRTSEEYITKAMSMIGISDKDAADPNSQKHDFSAHEVLRILSSRAVCAYGSCMTKE